MSTDNILDHQQFDKYTPPSLSDYYDSNGARQKDGGHAAPMFILVVALALFAAGSWGYGTATMIIALAFMGCNLSDGIDEKDKLEIKFNILSVGDIFKQMLRWEAKYLYALQERKQEDPKLLKEGKSIVLAGLASQVQRYKQEANQTDTAAVVAQESVFLALRRFESDDNVMISAMSLMALIAKNSKVREKTLLEADAFGLDLPIKVLRKGLKRAKQIENNDEKELRAAELQRKGFLMLGALADGERDIARLVVKEGGSDAALDALDWFRCHAHVVNWALWFLFIICYEEPSNKVAIVQYQGIPKIIEAMGNCTESLDVARHGVALLFDLLREDTATCQPNVRLDIWKMRDSARSAGLHTVILEIMQQHEAADVTMMATELLAGTGYSETKEPESTVQIEELD